MLDIWLKSTFLPRFLTSQFHTDELVRLRSSVSLSRFENTNNQCWNQTDRETAKLIKGWCMIFVKHKSRSSQICMWPVMSQCLWYFNFWITLTVLDSWYFSSEIYLKVVSFTALTVPTARHPFHHFLPFTRTAREAANGGRESWVTHPPTHGLHLREEQCVVICVSKRQNEASYFLTGHLGA